jgi:hypothetical protein
MSPGGLSMWETGKRTPPATEVARILTMLGVTGERYTEIIGLTEHIEVPNWLAVTLEEQRRHLSALLRFEREASSITAVSPLLVPGPLQTRATIEAIMADVGVPAEEVDSRVAIRLGRREVLDRVTYTAVIGEGVLRQQVGGRDVLLDQLRHLLAMSERVNLRLIPYTAGWNPALEGAWTVIGFDEDPTVVHMENRRSGGLFMDAEEDVAAYRDATASAIEAAMSPTQTRELIAEEIKRIGD